MLYPCFGITTLSEPKHQWMIGHLIQGDVTGFRTMVEHALAEARPDTDTVILSSEGLFHRWWDFPEAGLDALRWLAGRYPVQLWVFFREPVSFARSLYIQMLKNPRGLGPGYGLDMSFSDMLSDARFAVHFDYIGYVRQVERYLGEASVRPFPYSGDTVADVLAALGLSGSEMSAMREHRTVGSLGVSMLREINQRELSLADKAKAVQLIESLDRLVDDYGRPFMLSPADVDRIDTLSRPSLDALAQAYDLTINLQRDFSREPF